MVIQDRTKGNQLNAGMEDPTFTLGRLMLVQLGQWGFRRIKHDIVELLDLMMDGPPGYDRGNQLKAGMGDSTVMLGQLRDL